MKPGIQNGLFVLTVGTVPLPLLIYDNHTDIMGVADVGKTVLTLTFLLILIKLTLGTESDITMNSFNNYESFSLDFIYVIHTSLFF